MAGAWTHGLGSAWAYGVARILPACFQPHHQVLSATTLRSHLQCSIEDTGEDSSCNPHNTSRRSTVCPLYLQHEPFLVLHLGWASTLGWQLRHLLVLCVVS